jgi:hypothetical protein
MASGLAGCIGTTRAQPIVTIDARVGQTLENGTQMAGLTRRLCMGTRQRKRRLTVVKRFINLGNGGA